MSRIMCIEAISVNVWASLELIWFFFMPYCGPSISITGLLVYVGATRNTVLICDDYKFKLKVCNIRMYYYYYHIKRVRTYDILLF